jgi:golgin subfamily A member 4
LKVEPVEHFLEAYKQNIEELSAKDGLGKTYGQPRRYAQERLRSEMTKCENAQRGINNAIDRLEALCEKAAGPLYKQSFDYASEKQALSLEIRATLISIIRMMINYGRHLDGFSETAPADLPRISQLETAESTELHEEEKELEEQRLKDEVAALGTISKEAEEGTSKKFPEAITAIDTVCRDLVSKLYTGDNAKYLVGDQKIPEYLSVFLRNTHRQVHDFKINGVRQLRMSNERLVELCGKVTGATLRYLQNKYESTAVVSIAQIEAGFVAKAAEDAALKQKHLRLFRPNLENPENKQITEELNSDEQARSAAINEVSIPIFLTTL